MLSQHVTGGYASELLGDGATAVGYLLKQRIADARNFCSDLCRVAGGGIAPTTTAASWRSCTT